MNKLQAFRILPIVFLLLGCGRSQSDSTSESVKDRVPVADSMRQVNDSPFHPLACKILDGFPESIREINGNSRLVLNGDDSCVLRLLDSLSGRFVADQENVYMAALDSLARVSDGYVSEYFGFVSYELYKGALPKYIEYLQSVKDKSRLRGFLVEGIEATLDTDSKPDKRLEEIRKIFTDANLPPQQKEYVEKILQEAKVSL